MAIAVEAIAFPPDQSGWSTTDQPVKADSAVQPIRAGQMYERHGKENFFKGSVPSKESAGRIKGQPIEVFNGQSKPAVIKLTTRGNRRLR